MMSPTERTILRALHTLQFDGFDVLRVGGGQPCRVTFAEFGVPIDLLRGWLALRLEKIETEFDKALTILRHKELISCEQQTYWPLGKSTDFRVQRDDGRHMVVSHGLVQEGWHGVTVTVGTPEGKRLLDAWQKPHLWDLDYGYQCFRITAAGIAELEGVAQEPATPQGGAMIVLKDSPPAGLLHGRRPTVLVLSEDLSWIEGEARIDFGQLAATIRSLRPAVPPDSWMTVSECAKLLLNDVDGLDLEKAKARVSWAAGENKFRTNGKKGPSRRIDRDSFSTWRIKQRERNLDADNEAY